MKFLKKKDINLLFDIKELERITNINIYKIINILSLRSYEINEEKKIYMKKIFLLLRIPKNKLFFLYLKKQIIKINYLPIPTYLATLELLNKKLIINK